MTSEGKIPPLEVIAERIVAMKHRGKRIVHCHGCFDHLHIGHIKHLQAARTMGDALIVTVTPDKYDRRHSPRPRPDRRSAASDHPARSQWRDQPEHRPRAGPG